MASCSCCSSNVGTRFNWTVKNFRFLRENSLRSSNFIAEELCNSQWQVELYFDQRESTHLQGCLMQTTPYCNNFQDLLVIISTVDDSGTNTTVFDKLYRNFVLRPSSRFRFACDADGESYPYDSLRLCVGLALINEPSIDPIEYECQTLIGKETFQRAFFLSSNEIQSYSPTEIFVYYPVNKDLPHMKFRILVTQQDNVYLEVIKNTTLMYDFVVFCGVTLLFNGGSVFKVTSDWLRYQAHTSDNVRHLKNILTPIDITKNDLDLNSFTLKLEVSFCTHNDILMEVKSLPESLKEEKSDYPEHNVDSLYESSVESENSDKSIWPCTLSASVIGSLQDKSNSSPSTSSNYGLDKLFESKLDLHSDMKNNKHTLMNDIWVAYNEEKYSDLKICAGNKSFLVHKTILKARSPVFATMLE